MSVVKFAHVCDKCGTRQAEYKPIARCYFCEEETCDACTWNKPAEWDENGHSQIACNTCGSNRTVLDVYDPADFRIGSHAQEEK